MHCDINFTRNRCRYFQVEDAKDGVYADRALSHLTLCCTWYALYLQQLCSGIVFHDFIRRFMSELLGMLKIPIVLIFVALGQILM